MTETINEYKYHDAEATWANAYIWPVLRREAVALLASERPTRVLDLGCGNGATSGMLNELGFEAIGVDPSESGVDQALRAFPNCHFEVASAYEDLAAKLGQFQLVVSLEVVEHLYDPRAFASRLHDLVEPGGVAFVSTPYHGYLKNLALAVSGRMDQHFTALWDGGHIKFFSIRSLSRLLSEAGFKDIRCVRVGRIPWLAKSMIAIARKDAAA